MSAIMNQPQLQEKKKRVKKVIPTCDICVEPYNKSTRLLVKCPYCNYEACRTCCETYILNETEVKCMSPECSKIWTRKHIREIFTLVFINGPLKEHKEKVLFDKERALLPATQPIIEGKLLARKIDQEIRVLQKQISEINKQQTKLLQDKQVALNRKTNTDRTAFVRACPQEDCRGFLSSQWKCGICERWTCPDCHVLKGYTRDSDHTCNADDLATAKLISSDTKPCPQCGTGIFKIDGCDQMWCTECHTAFSWRTGRKEQNIHNPHYYEWQRRIGGGEAPRNPGDIPCGRNLDHYLSDRFQRLMRSYYLTSKNYATILTRIQRIIRWAVHLINVERPNPPNYERKNENLRVQYLMKEITEQQMRDELQRDDKRHHKNQELAEVFTLLVNTVTDILYRFLDYLEQNKDKAVGNPANIDISILVEIERIVDYANECLGDISHTYSCSRFFIDYDLMILKGQRAVALIRTLKESKKAECPVGGSDEAPTNRFIDDGKDEV